MIAIAGEGIVTSLGSTVREVFDALCAGRSGVREGLRLKDLAEPFAAACVAEDERWMPDEKHSRLERMMIHATAQAVAESGIDAADPRTLFVVSTTKGNVELLETVSDYDDPRLYLWHTAQVVARHFGNANAPVTVSNACISGAAAQIAARRALESRRYDAAVVVGGDVLSRFIVSGFQSFKALSPEECRPFDAERRGLNLGEGAAAIVYTYKESACKGDIILEAGAIRNDANHISGPSRTGEGLYNALRAIMPDDTASIAFVNAHGTATPYNDEMESIALQRAGLLFTPVNSLKACFGHTLGAAGVIESIVSTHALREGTVLPSRGFRTSGVSAPIDIAIEARRTHGERCIKMLSGFGGCNAALLFRIIR